jgi:hypothetical protein
LRRRRWISLIAIIIVSVSALFSLYAYNNLLLSQGFNPDSIPESDVESIGQYYLSKPPYFPDNGNRITKIFLESSHLRYDYSNVSFKADSGYDTFKGVRAVVVNATIRNDYNIDEIIQTSQEGGKQSIVWLDAYLYDEEGDIVNTLHQGNPIQGTVRLELKSGETASVNMVFATPDWNIDHFEIYVSYLPNVKI